MDLLKARRTSSVLEPRNSEGPARVLGSFNLTFRACSIATGADSKIARQEQGESTWDPHDASELAPNSANGLIPSLIAWAKSEPPGNDAIVSFLGYQPHGA